MRGAVLHAPGDVRVEHREDPKILAPTDAIIRLAADQRRPHPRRVVSTRDTVWYDTPAAAATSRMLGAASPRRAGPSVRVTFTWCPTRIPAEHRDPLAGCDRSLVRETNLVNR